MAVIRRRAIPIVPVKVELDLEKIRAKAKPVLRRAPAPSSIEEIKARLALAVPVDHEKNSDGTSYTDTIARYASKVHNPLTAIRAKCVECSGGSLKEVTECRVLKCALHPFRMGNNPFHKKIRDRMEREGADQDQEEGDDA